MIDLIECRTVTPVRVTDWSEVDEAHGVVCACCGWSGRLGQCATRTERNARLYACGECGMNLLARVLPRIVEYVGVSARQEWRRAHGIAANF